MSEAQSLRGRVAALHRHGADAETIRKAQRPLCDVMVRQEVDRQREALGLPPLDDGLAAVVTRVAFLPEAA